MASITSASKTSNCARSSSNDHRSFGLFPYLNDDLKRVILSFVADAPMETATHGVPPRSYVKSSLTHQLPHVSRKFRDMSQADAYWKDAVLRQTKKEPVLWETALREIIAEKTAPDNAISNHDDEMNTSSSHKKPRDAQSLVQRALEAHHQQQQQQQPQESICGLNSIDSEHHDSSFPTRKTYKSLYRHVVSNHLRFKGPVFSMPGQVQLGEPYALHFVDPRYRFLIAEVMRDFPDEARQGGPIIGTSTDKMIRNKVPLFLHANRDPLEPTIPAVVVQVLRCHIHADNGGADVVLLPLHHVWLEKLWVGSVSQHTGNLYYAQALRMPQHVTHCMNQLARQEVLANVMDQIATTLSVASSSLDSDDDDDTMDSDDSSDDDDSQDDDDDDDDDQSDFSDSELDDDSVDFEEDDNDNDDFENVQGAGNENYNTRQGL